MSDARTPAKPTEESRVIKKIKLKNFKRFLAYEMSFQPSMNIIIGDNEAGKSTILHAIDILLSGNRSKIESAGLENLFNQTAIRNFFSSGRKYADLPELSVELYLSDLEDPFYNGVNNSDSVECDGLRLICKPNDTLGPVINEILSQTEDNFPFEYYSINIETFAGQQYYGQKKPIKWVSIDASLGNGEYSAREYIHSIYECYTEPIERAGHRNKYRKLKHEYSSVVLNALNEKSVGFRFDLRNNAKSNLDTDITVLEDGIGLEYKGKGKQCFIKADIALNKRKKTLDLVMMEEPENHLSYVNMKRLIEVIRSSVNRQMLITTHSPMICTRLDLRNVLIVSVKSQEPQQLGTIDNNVAKYFLKAPDTNLLDFILAPKVILVEGAAEYVLMERLVSSTLGKSMSISNIHIISVNGTAFKNYMRIASQLKIKTAVIRDNDGNFKVNCDDNYTDEISDIIRVFYDADNSRKTFEVCVYEDNNVLCDKLFGGDRRSLSVQDYMLSNKTDAAFRLLECADEIKVPAYIAEAIKWINS